MLTTITLATLLLELGPHRAALVELRQASSAAARTLGVVSTLQRDARDPDTRAHLAEVERLTADAWNRFGLIEAELLELGPDLPERWPCKDPPRICALELIRGTSPWLELVVNHLSRLVPRASSGPVFFAGLEAALRYTAESWVHLDRAALELALPSKRESSLPELELFPRKPFAGISLELMP